MNITPDPAHHCTTPSASHASSTGRTLRLVAAGPDLFRVVDGRSLILGHLAVAHEAGGDRFRARRYRAASGGFIEVGEFDDVAEAVACLDAA